MIDLSALSGSVVTGDAEKVEELTRKALDEGMTALKILNDGLVIGMDVIGEKFKSSTVGDHKVYDAGGKAFCLLDSRSLLIGDKKVIEADKKKRRVSLSLKLAGSDPWSTVEHKYPVGSRHQAQVVELVIPVELWEKILVMLKTK